MGNDKDQSVVVNFGVVFVFFGFSLLDSRGGLRAVEDFDLEFAFELYFAGGEVAGGFDDLPEGEIFLMEIFCFLSLRHKNIIC